MLTVSLHLNESVFVYLNGTSTEKKSINQLGLVELDFSFCQSFLYKTDASDKLTELFRDTMKALKLSEQEIYVSVPTELMYLSFHESIKESDIQKRVDQDVWMTELKMGSDFIEMSDCQVRVKYSDNRLATLTAVYFPKIMTEIFQTVCKNCGCTLKGIGINLFNISNFIENTAGEKDYYILNLIHGNYELLKVDNRRVVGYSHFACYNGELILFARTGSIDADICRLLTDKRYKGRKLLDRVVYAGCESSCLNKFDETVSRLRTIKKISPVRETAAYKVDKINYDKQYDVIFAASLGVLF